MWGPFIQIWRRCEGPLWRLLSACPSAKGRACISLRVESHAQISCLLTGCKVAFAVVHCAAFLAHIAEESLPDYLLPKCGNNQPVIKIWEGCPSSSCDRATTKHLINISGAWEILNGRTLYWYSWPQMESICIHVPTDHLSRWKRINPCEQSCKKHLFEKHQEVQDWFCPFKSRMRVSQAFLWTRNYTE